ncbi:MAG TPA: DUF6782 family putative metallopeptidase [Blastocatellia bacterium]|nr:DUF6782 family putative metallopeptidase [Blastocatellia bacterium]
MRRRLTAGAALVMALVMFLTATTIAWQGAVSIKGPDTAALKATEEILGRVSRLRGLEIKHQVKSGFKTKDEIGESVIKDLDEGNTPEEFDATTKMLLKLGLVPAGFPLRDFLVKLLREQVAGFYEPKTKEFYLAAWLPVAEQKTVIAHELVHALQDQHFNLRRFEKWPKGDSDAELAAHALVEGDATLVMFQYAFDQQGMRMDLSAIGSLTDKLLEQGDDDDKEKYPVLSSAPSVLREGLQFPYVYGIGFVQEVLKKRSLDQLNSIYTDLPTSTEQVMHPERYLVRDHPVRIELADLTSTLGAGWKQIDADVNGEFGYHTILAEYVAKRLAHLAAEGWDGDRYALYEDGKTGALLLAHYTTWDSERDAKEFFEIYIERTEKRYHVDRTSELNAQHRVYETSDGLVSIELRNSDVVIVEGARTREQLDRAAQKLWESRKNASPR